MTGTLLPRMFTLEIDGKPTLVFEAKTLREAHELCREEWLRADLSVLAITAPGDVVLTEAFTFPGIKAAAEKLRVHLIGVPMDADGVQPDALRRACERHNPKAVYLTPTLHNPTTATPNGHCRDHSQGRHLPDRR